MSNPPVRYRKCAICRRPTVTPRSLYCARCRGHLYGRQETAKRRAALTAAYDRDLDGFRCHYSGVPLEEEDDDDPFYLVFDHEVPRESSGLVASSALLNSMKSQLGPGEFPRAIRELAAHRGGRPFDKGAVGFIYWTLRRPFPAVRPPRRRGPGGAPPPPCIVCGEPSSGYAHLCARCHAIVFRSEFRHAPCVEALREAWSPGAGGFLCHFTGVRLDEADPESPWHLYFDHGVPGDDSTIVVAASWVNAMKTDLSEAEFWKVVAECDRHLREGGEFDRRVVGFDYWRRAREKRRAARGRHL